LRLNYELVFILLQRYLIECKTVYYCWFYL